MIEIERLSPRAHRIVVMGAFHYADAEKAVAFARERLASGEGGNLLVDLTALADFSFAAVSDQLMHLPTMLQFLHSLGRIAIISDEDWLRSAARLESALLPGVVYQVYDDDEQAAARAWVLEEEDAPHHGAFRELELGGPAIAAFELAGRIDRAAAESALAMVRARLGEPECAKLLLVIRAWHGFDADTVFSQSQMAAKIDLMNHLERYAIVGGPDWLRGVIAMANPLVTPEVRGFEAGGEAAALAWLNNG